MRILFEDDDLLIVEKPAGIPTCPLRDGKKSLQEILAGQYAGERTACHRLDNDTSGLVVFAKNPETHAAMREAFSKDRVEREYVALVQGKVSSKGKVVWPIGPDPKSGKKVRVYKNLKEARRHRAQAAVTTFTPVPSFLGVRSGRGGTTWLHITIKGGRRHQIRAHLAAIGHPVICLHASRLTFSHPNQRGKNVDVRSEEFGKSLDN